MKPRTLWIPYHTKIRTKMTFKTLCTLLSFSMTLIQCTKGVAIQHKVCTTLENAIKLNDAKQRSVPALTNTSWPGWSLKMKRCTTAIHAQMRWAISREWSSYTLLSSIFPPPPIPLVSPARLCLNPLQAQPSQCLLHLSLHWWSAGELLGIQLELGQSSHFGGCWVIHCLHVC